MKVIGSTCHKVIINGKGTNNCSNNSPERHDNGR